MSRRLPPLSAVRAFEAAARHGSFQRAGEELHVSAGAVAHQVKQLEAWLGVELFRRLARGVVLSPAGQRYADALDPLLNALADASEAVRRQNNDERIVTVTSMPTLVTNWLMPRLGRLREQHPEIDMRVLSSTHTVDFQRDGVDVAIRLGTGPYPGLKAEVLMDEWFSAVCSPAFRAAANISAPADLLRQPLLHDEMEARIPDEINWTRWLQAFGVNYTNVAGPSFSHTYLTLETAAAGQGIALGAEPFIAAYLRSGRLVRLFPQRVQGPYRFHLLRPPAAEARPLVQAFCKWIKAEVRADEDGLPQVQ